MTEKKPKPEPRQPEPQISRHFDHFADVGKMVAEHAEALTRLANR